MAILNSKKGMVIEKVMVPIVLMILLIIGFVFFYNNSAQAGTDAVSCKGMGGVLRTTCNPEFSDHNSLFDADERLCCVNKFIGGDKEKFKEWAESGEGSTGTTLLKRLYFEVYNTKIEQGMKPIAVPSGTVVTFLALNNLKPGKCTVIIQEAERKFDLYIPKVINNPANFPENLPEGIDCPLGKRIESQRKFTAPDTGESEFYLMTYSLIADGKTTNLTAVINVTKAKVEEEGIGGAGSGEDDGTEDEISPFDITTIVSQTAARDQVNYCFISAYLTENNIRDNSILSFKHQIVPQDIACSWSSGFISLNKELSLTPTFSDASTHCVLFEDNDFLDVRGEASASSAGCHILHVAPYQIYEKYFETPCTSKCSDYVGSNKIACYDFKVRNKECQYTQNCNFVKDGLFKYDCLDCDSQVINCSNYDTKRSCEENQCLTDEYCQWTFGVPSGTCRTVGYVGGEAQLFDLGLD